MGVLQRFEKRLENLVEGAFARVFKGVVHPVEIASAMQHEADGHKRILDGGRTLVPNRYIIDLSPSDHDQLAQYAAPLAQELAQAQAEFIGEQGWTVYGDVIVEIERGDDLDTGRFRVAAEVYTGGIESQPPPPQSWQTEQASYAPSTDPYGAPTNDPYGQTSSPPGSAYPASGLPDPYGQPDPYGDPYARQQPDPYGQPDPYRQPGGYSQPQDPYEQQRPNDPYSAPPASGAGYGAGPGYGAPGPAGPGLGRLPSSMDQTAYGAPPVSGPPIQQGPPQARLMAADGRQFPIGSGSTVIGRGEGSQIRLADVGISRQHARLDFEAGRVVLTDLGSTNGTTVNGNRVNAVTLQHGDVIQLGTTTLTFRLDG